MRRQLQPYIANIGFVLATLGLASTMVQGQPLPRTRLMIVTSSALQRTTQLRQLTVEVLEGVFVRISAASSLSDAVSYTSGDKFVVVVPQAVVASFQSDVTGRNFLSVQFEQRGEDVAISFRLRSGASARLDSKAAGLEVTFAAPNVAVMNTGTESVEMRAVLPQRVDPNPQDLAVVTGNAAPAPMLRAATEPIAVQGGAAASLPSLLNSLFPGAANDVTADTSNIDLSVPESPAATVLGVTPNTIVRPGTPREFATSLLNGLDQNGNLQTGLALDTAPFMLFNGANVTLQDYNSGYLTRLLSRTQFSLAATKGASADDTSARLALGFNLTLLDKGDARVYHPDRGPEGDVLTCFKANIKPPREPSSANPSQAERDQIKADTKAINDPVADNCRETVRKANWNRTSWIVAYAPSWISENGKTSDFRWNGGAFWTSFAYGFEEIPSLNKIGQLILHARFRTKEQVDDPANPGQFLSQNSTIFGGRFRAGNPSFAFNLEGAWVRNHPSGLAAFNANRFSLGAEARVSANLYLVVSGGSNLGDSGGQKKGFLMTSFKYGFNKKSQFNPQQ
jgi:hypothetical protein